ncbi:MAG TPA: hypothetical protein VJU84_21670 [Pyrinomonadaceae bacterium]|nr:hypothetical protein [Pyrinomonadaceae bacterium]
MKRVFLSLCLLSFLAVSGRSVHACTCSLIWPTDAPESKYPEIRRHWIEDFKGAVFVGRVLKLEKAKVRWKSGVTEMRKVTVKVGHRWVGAESPEVIVYSSLGSCDKGYKKGREYFFFADPRDGMLEVAACIPSTLNNEVINSFRVWFGEAAKPNNGMHPTADTQVVKFQ